MTGPTQSAGKLRGRDLAPAGQELLIEEHQKAFELNNAMMRAPRTPGLTAVAGAAKLNCSKNGGSAI